MKFNRNIALVLIAFGMASSVMAQSDDRTELPDSLSVAPTQNADSLTQMVQQLSQEVAQLRNGNDETARQQKIWRKSNPLTLSIGGQKLTNMDADIKYKSNLAVGLSKMRTFYVHPKPLANMVKIGIDAVWFDLSYARYEKGKGVKGIMNGLTGTVTDGVYDNMDDYFDHAYNEALDYDDEDAIDIWNSLNLGKHSLTANLGVGPSVKIAPFYMLNKPALDKIKASLYLHWLPGFTTLLFTGDDDIEGCYGALLNHFSVGFNISYGRFGIGVEHRWGKAKLTMADSDDDNDYDYDYDYGSQEVSGNDKTKYKLGSTRFYIGVRF